MGKENITQFTVKVDLHGLPRWRPCAQSFVSVQTIEIDLSHVLSCGRHGDHPAWAARFQALQQEVGQKEVADVVDPKHHSQAILCPTL